MAPSRADKVVGIKTKGTKWAVLLTRDDEILDFTLQFATSPMEAAQNAVREWAGEMIGGSIKCFVVQATYLKIIEATPPREIKFTVTTPEEW